MTYSLSAAGKTFPGECQAQVFTKKYLKGSGTGKTYDEKMHYIYTCDYICLDNEGLKHTIQALHDKRVTSDAYMAVAVVCDGVKMKKFILGGKEYFEFSHVLKFYSQDSKLKEIKSWAKDHNIAKFSLRKDKRIKKVKSSLKQMNNSYELTIKGLHHSQRDLISLLTSTIEYNNLYIRMPNEELYAFILKLKSLNRLEYKLRIKNAKNSKALEIALEYLLSSTLKLNF